MEYVTSYWYFKLFFFPPSSLENCYEKPAGKKKLPGLVPGTHWVLDRRSNRFAILVVHKFPSDIFFIFQLHKFPTSEYYGKSYTTPGGGLGMFTR